jgi:hypothetical protein
MTTTTPTNQQSESHVDIGHPHSTHVVAATLAHRTPTRPQRALPASRHRLAQRPADEAVGQGGGGEVVAALSRSEAISRHANGSWFCWACAVAVYRAVLRGWVRLALRSGCYRPEVWFRVGGGLFGWACVVAVCHAVLRGWVPLALPSGCYRLEIRLRVGDGLFGCTSLVAALITYCTMSPGWSRLVFMCGRRLARPVGMVRQADGPFVAPAARLLIEAGGLALRGPGCCSHRALPVFGRLLDGVRAMILVPS